MSELDGEYSGGETFEGCLCEHAPEDHGWAGCELTDCFCPGHWTE